jgi:hypothetical protein
MPTAWQPAAEPQTPHPVLRPPGVQSMAERHPEVSQPPDDSVPKDSASRYTWGSFVEFMPRPAQGPSAGYACRSWRMASRIFSISPSCASRCIWMSMDV